ncbi:MAG TPA: GGDEF domain-containing protein [Thermoanaerobaculia bacterium]|nr:GGDEF domain-containing protein [Thermoanaerobaculia bacterium]
MSTSESSVGSEDHARISDLVTLIQELTSRGIASESTADLFAGAFATLFRCVPFDVAVAVMIEQNLDFYISTRAGEEALVDEALIARIRTALESRIPVSFATTDVVVKSESHALEARTEVLPLHQQMAHGIDSMIQVKRRIAGFVFLFRHDPPFTDEHHSLIDIFTTQMALLLDNLSSRERIQDLADSDDLTGIWNKRYFRRQLPHEIERARVYNLPLSLLMFDVDDFKQINDGFGHTIGDVVLSELCGAVRETIRPPDFFVRFGGDEFAVVLPHTDLSGAAAVAERILSRVRDLTIPTDEEGFIRCSVSIGLADYRSGETANDLIRRADERLYDAKRAGKNRIA